MLKWLLTLAITLIVLSAASPALTRTRLGHLPGDITVRIGDRVFYLPFTSTILVSALMVLIGKLI